MQRIHLNENCIPCLHFKATPFNCCACAKGWILGKHILMFFKVMLFCSTSGKMASFLVRQCSENEVHVTSILNVQSTLSHNVHPTAIIRHIKRYTPKGRWDLMFKERLLLYVFLTFKTYNDEKGTTALRPKMTFIRRRDFTFTLRSSNVFVGQWEHVY